MGQSDNKRQSRLDARVFRQTVQSRAQGRCKGCDFYCPWIGHVHHVKAVEYGGRGWPDNLIFLCPNCHAVVEKIKTKASDDPAFEQWIYQAYGYARGENLISIAYEVFDVEKVYDDEEPSN